MGLTGAASQQKAAFLATETPEKGLDVGATAVNSFHFPKQRLDSGPWEATAGDLGKKPL